MRIISIIAAFVLPTFVWANVTPSNSGVTDATSLQTRSLRGEVHEARIRPHTPVDSIVSSDDESTSAKLPAGGDQAPPSRKRKSPITGEEAPSTENSGKAAFTHDQLITDTVRKARFVEKTHGHSGTSNGNHMVRVVSYEQPKSTFRNERVNTQITENGGGLASKTGQPSTGTLPPLRQHRRQNAQLDLASFTSQMSSMYIGQTSGRSFYMNGRGFDSGDSNNWF
jgi:hypothetical protein